MVLPHLNYCCTIWETTSDTNIGKLQKIQNCGMRIILQCHPRTHIAAMLSNLKWWSIKQWIMFAAAVLVFKIMHYKTLNYMSHWLVPVSHQYGTRRSTSGDIFVPRSHQNSLTTKGTRRPMSWWLQNIYVYIGGGGGAIFFHLKIAGSRGIMSGEVDGRRGLCFQRVSWMLL